MVSEIPSVSVWEIPDRYLTKVITIHPYLLVFLIWFFFFFKYCWKIIAKSKKKVLKSKSIPIEMTSNELLDPSLVHGMQILKLVHCWKLLNVQAIWSDNIWKGREKAEVDIFRVREILNERTSVPSKGSMWTVNIYSYHSWLENSTA